MIDNLRQHIINRVGKKPDNLEHVLDHFEEFSGERGQHLLVQGDVCKHVYYIAAGCIQVYIIDRQGQESTREFYVEDQWVTDIFGFQNQLPANESIKCVEACRLLRIHYDSFQLLSQQAPQFAAIYKEILEVSYNNTVYRVNALTAMNALERIRWLMENKPKIMTRLSSKLIASYLGISPETMTRLKSKL
ncbi:Crp/Fnr family transcriptional regulator [Chryseolinea lacunae]|uniref:Crp/Fnr family transcriptional regulator n=1 Tax=Chryseolinea lacunae TaxID=2801331 RepID=A0ABS1KL63_9BACT|nr:Crp/Fnr family transcriptional regulator [Chryseolinea lacunae]MBL0739967.1 Crp/Fnr family transcriptional regulator [Chryseolinea lacunae]